ncbi:MAG: hypothetical protein ACTHMI_24260 [Mucilaginibacter sp.]
MPAFNYMGGGRVASPRAGPSTVSPSEDAVPVPATISLAVKPPHPFASQSSLIPSAV